MQEASRLLQAFKVRGSASASSHTNCFSFLSQDTYPAVAEAAGPEITECVMPRNAIQQLSDDESSSGATVNYAFCSDDEWMALQLAPRVAEMAPSCWMPPQATPATPLDECSSSTASSVGEEVWPPLRDPDFEITLPMPPRGLLC